MNNASKQDDFLWGNEAGSQSTENSHSPTDTLNNEQKGNLTGAEAEYLEDKWKEISISENEAPALPLTEDVQSDVEMPVKIEEASMHLTDASSELSNLNAEIEKLNSQLESERKSTDLLRQENRLLRIKTQVTSHGITDDKLNAEIKRVQLKEKELDAKCDLLRRDMQTLLASKDKHILELQQKWEALRLDFESLEDKLRERTLILQDLQAKKRRLCDTLQIVQALASDLDQIPSIQDELDTQKD